MLKKIIKNKTLCNDISQFINYVIGYGMVLFLNYGLNFLVNKKLTVNELGLFSYVQGLINIIFPILCLGFFNSYLRYHKDHTLSVKLLRTARPFYLFSALGCAIVIGIITKSFMSPLYALIVFFTEKQYILRVQMQIWKLNFLRCLELLVPLICMATLFLMNKDVEASWLLFFYGVGFCTSFLFSSKSKINNDDVPKKELVKYLFPVVGTSMITYLLLNIGVIFAKSKFGLQGAAEWGVAFRCVMIYKSLTALFLIFFPMIYFREAQKGNYKIINTYRIGIILFALAAFLPFALFPDFIYTLSGAAKYKETSALLVLLICAELCNFTASLYGLFFNFEIKTWKNTIFKGAELILFSIGILFSAQTSILMLGVIYLVVSATILVLILYFSISQELRYFKAVHQKKEFLS